jgi:hypothetical protein
LCTNFKGPNQPRTDYKPYDKWNYEDMDTLARIKSVIAGEDFDAQLTEHVTEYYKDLVLLLIAKLLLLPCS